jgi:type VI secretion system protein ImpJ
MGADNKIVWSEGMFLRPQHFQQHDRYIERLVRSRVAGITPCAYGVSELKLNRDLLIGGKFGVSQCRGILPDGTPFDILADGNHPVPLQLGDNVRDEIIYLTLPEQQPGAVEIAANGHDAAAARFGTSTYRAFDAVAGSETTADVEVGKLRLRYALESSDRAGYVSLGLARVIEVRSDNSVLLDDAYIPPALACAAVAPLAGFITEVQLSLHKRGDNLAHLATQSGVGAMEMGNFLMLQIINRYEPLLNHYASLSELHPVTLYATLLEIAGEFSTFMAPNKRPTAFPEYLHDDLQKCFTPVMVNLRHVLAELIDPNAINIPLEDRPYDMKLGVLANKRLLDTASFVVAVRADMPLAQLQRSFPSLAKIGPSGKLHKLVNDMLNGIPMRALPQVPRQIPYNRDSVYFELDRNTPLWADLKKGDGFGFHVSAEDFPGHIVELWAIKR